MIDLSDQRVRAERGRATREAILAAAEQLFAERGVITVSNRQIGEAAGQGNNTVVGYHFGSKADLVRAIVAKHIEDVERIRTRMVAAAAGSTDIRDWVACVVRPTTEHLAGLGNTSWYARFVAQVMTDPGMRTIVIADAADAPALRLAKDELTQHLPDLPAPLRAARNEMAILLLVHTTAEYERALAAGAATPWADWDDAANGLIDAIVGLLQAPRTG